MLSQEQQVENLTYLNDPRVRAAEIPCSFESLDENAMTGTIRLGDETRSMGFKYEVCDLCSGKGSHVNPSIDAGGLCDDDVDEDFWERYMGGAYDVPCAECRGSRVVPVPVPRNSAEEATLQELDKWQEALRQSADLQRAELLAGA